MCMTHGHGLREGMGHAGGGVQGRGEKGEEQKWDRCNSIINKIYLKFLKNKTRKKVNIIQLVIACIIRIWHDQLNI